MTKLKIIGREYERAIIRNYLESDKAELIAVYGRRRVGKTYLVKSIFKRANINSLTIDLDTPFISGWTCADGTKLSIPDGQSQGR